MATVLDFSILSSLSIIFIFLFVFIGAWGLLTMVNPMKLDKKEVYSIMAFVLAFIVILSRPVLEIIAFSIPWLSLVLLIAFFLLFFGKIFNENLPTDELIQKPVVYGFLIFFVVVILLFGLANSFGQDLLEEQPGVSDADRVGPDGEVDTFVPVDGDLGELDSDAPPTVRNRATSDDLGSNIILTLFHPKILGMLFMLILATITILLIAR